MTGRAPARSGHRTLLTGHVATAGGVLGADLVLLALGVASLAGADPVGVYPAAQLVATWVLAPLAVGALATGVLLGLRTHWGVLRYRWVAAKLVLTTVLSTVVFTLLVPRLRVAATAAASGEAFTLADRLPLLLAPAVGSTLLLVALALAVAKPGGRLRRADGPATGDRRGPTPVRRTVSQR